MDEINSENIKIFEDIGASLIEMMNKKEMKISEFISGILGVYLSVVLQTPFCPKKTFNQVFEVYETNRKKSETNPS